MLAIAKLLWWQQSLTDLASTNWKLISMFNQLKEEKIFQAWNIATLHSGVSVNISNAKQYH